MVEAIEKIGCIVLLDALGTKGRWKKGDTIDILQTWESLVNLYKGRFQDNPNDRSDFSKCTAFSDTIMIATAGSDHVANLLETSMAVSFLFSHAMMDGVFFRGCISYGKYYWSESLLIGPAVDEAAQYYMLPEWIGLSATPKAHTIISKIPNEKFDELDIPQDTFVNYDIPIKTGIEKNGYALNIPQAYECVLMDGGVYVKAKNPKKIELLLTEKLDETDDISASFKIRNTLNFFKSVPKTNVEELNKMAEESKKKAQSQP